MSLHEPDRGFAWVVLVASFFNQAIAMGTTYSVGIFIVEWMDTFGGNQENISWIGSINIAIVFGLAPVPGYLANCFSHRVVVVTGGLISTVGYVLSAFATHIYILYITYGVLVGAGVCSAYGQSAVFVGFYFKRRRSLALTLSAIGGGIGQVFFATFYRTLVHQYSWRGAMLLTGAVTLHFCVFGALFIPLPRKTEKKHGSICHNMLDLSSFKDYRVHIMIISHLLWTLGSAVVFLFLVDFAQDIGISKDHAAYIMSTSAIGGVLIRVAVSGLFALFPDVQGLYLYTFFCCLCGVIVLFLPLIHSFVGVFVVCCTFYTMYGGIIVTLGVSTVQIFSLQRATTVFSMLMMGCGIGGVFGPPLAGWMIGKTGGYSAPFFLAGTSLFLSSLIVIIGMFIDYHVACKASGNPLEDLDHTRTLGSISDRLQATMNGLDESTQEAKGDVIQLLADKENRSLQESNELPAEKNSSFHKEVNATISKT